MITVILSFTLGICLFALFYYIVRKHLPSSAKYPFQSWEKTDMPYIVLDIQGKKFNMITDSGASVSIIRHDVLDEIEWEPSSRKISLAALTNDRVDTGVVVIPIMIKGKETTHDFVVYGNEDIADFSNKYGITIHGILGVEFFKKTRGIVDFNKHAVIFP